MQNGFLAALGTLVIGAGMAHAQTPYYPPAYVPVTYWGQPGQPVARASVSAPLHQTRAADEPIHHVPMVPAALAQGQDDKRDPAAFPAAPKDAAPTTAPATPMFDATGIGSAWLWFGAEYLLWWVKDGPLPVPLVTTGSAADALPGALGQPGTIVLFGGDDLNYQDFSGLRLTLGGWLDGGQSFGLETSAFFLNQRSVNFRINSDGAGSPVIAVPFQGVGGAQNSELLSAPASIVGPLTGGINITSQSQLWGVECNSLFNIMRNGTWAVDLLAGIRYLDLEENLKIAYHSTITVGGIAAVPATANDIFQTRDQFYGAQIGARAGYRTGRLSLDFTGKLALGNTHQVVNISGSQTVSIIGAAVLSATNPGAIFTQLTNLGRTAQDELTVIPEFQLLVGYDLRDWLRLTVGYTFLYWDEVVRPGDQVNSQLNAGAGVAIPLAIGNIAQGFPAPSFNRTDFWAQGISFGLDLRY
jgi:hypothetical protein